jgi:hypothetical protein
MKYEEFAGSCQMVDLSGGCNWNIPFLKRIAERTAGGSVGALMVMFGVPAGLALGAYRAAGLIVGPAFATGTKGSGAGVTLNTGKIELVPK